MCCVKEGNLFVVTCSDPGRMLRNKVLMPEPLKMSTVRAYLGLSFPLYFHMYKGRERLHNGMSRSQDEVVYFVYGGVLFCTL